MHRDSEQQPDEPATVPTNAGFFSDTDFADEGFVDGGDQQPQPSAAPTTNVPR